jgi:hypothetical protein
MRPDEASELLRVVHPDGNEQISSVMYVRVRQISGNAVKPC